MKMPDCTGSGYKRTAASMGDPPRVGTAGGGTAANRTNFDSTAYGRKATAARADQAAAVAAAAANALSQFAHPAAPASKDAPAGWPSSRRDMDVSSMAALRAEQLKAASHSGAQQQHQHQQSSALAAAAAEKAPSHVLVARALGPVAGRAIVTERRAFLAQIDAAEHRVRELELELQQEREKVPMLRAREEAAYAREAMLRDERDASFAGTEATRLEGERLRAKLDSERARADRAEARCDELRRASEGQCASLRDELEVTQADWRCAEAEARQAERGLAVAQCELKGAAERIDRAERRARDEAIKCAELLKAAEKQCSTLALEREAARREAAAAEAALRAKEEHNQQVVALMREERQTLRAAADAAEARCQLALNQVAVIERDRTVTRSELAAAKLELQAAADASNQRATEYELRERRTRVEAHEAVTQAHALARQLGERCLQAERQAQVHSLLVDEALSSAHSGQAAASRTEVALRLERQKALDQQTGAKEAEWGRFAMLRESADAAGHPRAADGGGAGGLAVGGFGVGASAKPAEPLLSLAPPLSPATPLTATLASSGSELGRALDASSSAAAPWWWGTAASSCGGAEALPPPPPPPLPMAASPERRDGDRAIDGTFPCSHAQYAISKSSCGSQILKNTQYAKPNTAVLEPG